MPLSWHQTVFQQWFERQHSQRAAHAYLLIVPEDTGGEQLVQAMAASLLCDAPTSAHHACGQCAACDLLAAFSHPDYRLLRPSIMNTAHPIEELRPEKPSKEITIDDIRALDNMVNQTSHRGGQRVVVLYPAHKLNRNAANALLKTLEEPPGDVRFVLASEAAHQLLPTIRSRCLGHTMAWPAQAEMLPWLTAQGVPEGAAEVFLRTSGGRPDDALALFQSGQSPQTWAQLPQAMLRGDARALDGWTPAQAIEALQKLCHDVLLLRVGAPPRYFAPADLPAAPAIGPLTRWARELSTAARTAEHPFNPGLMLEALTAQARKALHSRH